MAHPGHDFVAETKGSCFLCSSNITSRSRTTATDLSESCPIYSLDCLSRYLKIDMKKVFTGSGPIPPHLVARVEQSRLKTELCENCVVLTRKFSKLYRQWEKTEMEMTSCLNLIQDNLERAVKPDNEAQYQNAINSNTIKDEWMAKLEIIEALRKDTRLKCSRRLSSVRPLTKLQKLTRKQINKAKCKIKPMKVAEDYQEPGHFPGANYDDFGSPSSPLNEDGNGCFGEQNHPSPSTIGDIYEEKPLITKQEVVRDGLQRKCQTTTKSTGKVCKIRRQTEQLSQAIPPPIKVESGGGFVEKHNIHKNPETGKYSCPICPKEYSLLTSTLNHYKGVHSNVKYKCTSCQMDFNFKHVYENHYLGVHLGVRFKCGNCDKSFSQKGQLMRHQKKKHLE